MLAGNVGCSYEPLATFLEAQIPKKSLTNAQAPRLGFRDSGSRVIHEASLTFAFLNVTSNLRPEPASCLGFRDLGFRDLVLKVQALGPCV